MNSVDMDVFPREEIHNITRESSGIVADVCIIVAESFRVAVMYRYFWSLFFLA